MENNSPEFQKPRGIRLVSPEEGEQLISEPWGYDTNGRYISDVGEAKLQIVINSYLPVDTDEIILLDKESVKFFPAEEVDNDNHEPELYFELTNIQTANPLNCTIEIPSANLRLSSDIEKVEGEDWGTLLNWQKVGDIDGKKYTILLQPDIDILGQLYVSFTQMVPLPKNN